MATVGELQAILTLNTAPFVAGVKSADASAKSMGDAMSSAGQGLAKVGLGMAAIGGIGMAGMIMAAKAAEEEEAAIVKLNNAIGNSPQMAGASADAFLEQAAALQDVTMFADDATIATQAMLATFGTTQDEVLGLTPLIQDLATVMDMDLGSATRLVGKAMAGNIGALGRVGVQVDAAAFATDRYGAVMEALELKAGGAAEALGQTFSGKLEILKNNLGDVAEGIGVGAVDAFNSLLGPVLRMSDAFQDLSPGMRGVIGKIGVAGSAALIAAGGVTLLASAALKLHAAWQLMAKTTIATRVGVMALNSGISAGALAIGGWTAAAVLAVGAAAMWANSMSDLTVEWQIDDLLTGTTAELRHAAVQFQAVTSAAGETGDALDAFTTLAETNIDAATRFGAAWIAAGGPASEIYMILNEAGRAAQLASLGLDANATSAEELAASYDVLSQRIDDYLGRIQGAEEAAAAEAEAQQSLADALMRNGHTFDINTAAGRENIAARNSWMDAVAGQIQAAADFAAQTGRTGEAQGRMNAAMRNAVGDLRRARDAGLITEEQFRTLSRQIQNIPRSVNITTDLQGEEAVISGLQRIYNEAIRAANAVGQTGGSLAGGGSYAPESAPGGGGGGESTPAPADTEAMMERAFRRALERTPVMTVGVG